MHWHHACQLAPGEVHVQHVRTIKEAFAGGAPILGCLCCILRLSIQSTDLTSVGTRLPRASTGSLMAPPTFTLMALWMLPLQPVLMDQRLPWPVESQGGCRSSPSPLPACSLMPTPGKTMSWYPDQLSESTGLDKLIVRA